MADCDYFTVDKPNLDGKVIRISMDVTCTPEEIVKNIAQTALAMLERLGIAIAIDQCVGAGIGVPGTIDRKAGICVLFQ